MKKSVLASVVLVALTMLIGPSLAQASAAAPTYYVSLGDSYSVGYQPNLGSTPGYTVPVAKKTADSSPNLTETTRS